MISMDRRRKTEMACSGLLLLLALASGVLAGGGQPPAVLAALAVAALAGLSGLLRLRIPKGRLLNLLEDVGSRPVGTVALAAAGFFAVGTENLWLLAVPMLVLEGVEGRNVRNVALLAGMVLALAVGASLFAGFPGASLAFVAGAIALASVSAFVLSNYRWRDEILTKRDRRLNCVLQCSAALAGSKDLHSMLANALRSAVIETEAECGYLMLVSEDGQDRLLTETAYSPSGAFEFPEELAPGTGVSGYAAKMGQPIAIFNDREGYLQVEGTGVGIHSALSVPLLVRNYRGASQSSVEHVMGAMTVLGSNPAQAFDADDIDLLSSLGSLVAVAVANSRMEERQRLTFLKTLESLAKSLEARDTYTRGHSERVCQVSLMIAEHLGFAPDAMEEIRVGTILHDIGKIGVPDAILNKPARLSDDEFEVMKSHPVIGYEICKPLQLSEGVLMIIRNHHEKLDGSGYPDGLKGGELPPSLRIVCVADAFDAMSSRRPYRKVMDLRKVLAEMSKGAGVQFDPVVVEALRELLPTDQMIRCYESQWSTEEAEAA
jgi:putative nucleotidyltransferase with HDIG domain